MAYFGVVIDGLLQSAPGGVQLRGPLDVDTYKISFTGDAIVEQADGFALRADGEGNPRGAYAIDLQQDRVDNDQVASGDYSIVLGGQQNKASGVNSIVKGGQINICAGDESIIIGGASNENHGDYSIIGGGSENGLQIGIYNAIGGGSTNWCQRSANYSTILGGVGDADNAGGEYCTLFGGYQNKLGQNTDYSTLFGGYYNKANPSDRTNYTCEYCFFGGSYRNSVYNVSYTVIVAGSTSKINGDYGCQIGGSDNQSGQYGFNGTSSIGEITGTHGVILSGLINSVAGDKSVIIGGIHNNALAPFTTIFDTGRYGLATLYGEVTQANYCFGATSGTAQTSVLIARNQTDSASPLPLLLDGNSERVVMPENMTWLFNARITGHRDTATESATYQIQGVIRRASTNNPVLVGSSKTVLAEDDASWDANVQVDTVNDALELEVTGANGKNINWVARIELISAGT